MHKLLMRLVISSTSSPAYSNSCLCCNSLLKYTILHCSPSSTITSSFIMMASLSFSWLVSQADKPEALSTRLRLSPVVLWMSLDTRLAMVATSLLVLALKLLKNLAYLVSSGSFLATSQYLLDQICPALSRAVPRQFHCCIPSIEYLASTIPR